MAERTIDGPQGRLALEVEGEGPFVPVVLVHADAGSKALWRETIDHLKRDRPVLALDLRGHGASAPPADGDFSYDGRAEDVEAAAGAAGLDRFVLVGHSGGAAVALSLAVAEPDRVAGLLLVDPVMDPAAIPEAQRRAALEALAGPDHARVAADYYRSIAGSNPETVARVLAEAARTPQATILGTMTALDSFRPADLADRYAGPILSVVLPEHDGPHALHSLIGVPHLVFDEAGAGHWLQIDAPLAFFDVLDGFLDAIDAGEAAAEA
jgi:pimeloyl-ACP methyl ester carboxylesterase